MDNSIANETYVELLLPKIVIYAQCLTQHPGEITGHDPLRSLVFPSPTGSMLAPFTFFFIVRDIVT